MQLPKHGLRLLFPLLIVAQHAIAADEAQTSDLRKAVPDNVYLAIHHQHNAERDYQRAYLQDVYEKVQETKIIERALKIATSRIPDADLEKAQSVLKELKEAVAPVDWDAIGQSKEIVYAQAMQLPSAQHLVLLRLTPAAAESGMTAIKNLFALVEKYSNGQVPVRTSKEGSVEFITLGLPPNVPFRPAVATFKDVLILSSSEQLARTSVAMLQGHGGPSKFDDARLQEALAKLPEPEDSLVFYDGEQQFQQLRDLGNFIRQMSGNDPDASRAAGLIESIFDDVSILDYEVTVEYTEGNRNCSATYGKLVPNAETKLLTKVFGSGQPFDNWQRWVPEDAVSYSLSTGANLHPIYERVVSVVKEQFPQAQEALEHFEQIQAALDVHLDRDILQAFSGESVSVSLPAAQPSALGGHDSVTVLRCRKPERIRELLHRLVDALQQHSAVQAQQLKLVESEDLEGFDELSAAMLAMIGVRPVIGFRDGWMIIGSNAQAVQKVLDTKAGMGKSIVETERFQQFGLEVDGPITAIKYTDLLESNRRLTAFLNQIGMMVPTLLSLVGGENGLEQLKPIQEIVALLPSVAEIVAEFDYLEAKLSITQQASEAGSYLRRSVTLVRPSS